MLSRNRFPSHQSDQFSKLVDINFVKLLQFGLFFWVSVGWGFGFLFVWDLFGVSLALFWPVFLLCFGLFVCFLFLVGGGGGGREVDWFVGGDIRKGKVPNMSFLQQKLTHLT